MCYEDQGFRLLKHFIDLGSSNSPKKYILENVNLNYCKISKLSFVSFSDAKNNVRSMGTHMLESSIPISAFVEMSSLPNSTWLRNNLSAIWHAQGTVMPCVAVAGG